MNPNKKSSSKQDPFLASAMGLGTQFAVAVGLSVFGGLKLDEKFDSRPLGLLGGLLLAFVYGVYEVWKVLRLTKNKAVKKDDGNDERE